MAWLRKNFIFQKRRRSLEKDAEVLGNTIPALMCLSGCMSDPLWGFSIQYPHIFLYTKHTIPKSICHVELHSMSRCPVAWYNTQTSTGHPIKSDVYTLKIIKFYLISIFFELTFMMNSMRHWNCAGCGHTFNKVEFHVSIFSRTFI